MDQQGRLDKIFFCFDLNPCKKPAAFSPIAYISPPKTDLPELGNSPKYDLLQEFKQLKEEKVEEEEFQK